MLCRTVYLFGLFMHVTLCLEIEPKIVGGDEISITSANYQVSIRYLSSDTVFGSGHLCGGSFITKGAVLTAAHCFYNSANKLYRATDLRVVAGNARLTDRDATTFVSLGTKLIYHPSYRHQKSFYADIGVIKLSMEFDLNNITLATIALPTTSYSEGFTCLISGWGTTSPNGDKSNNLLGAYIKINNLAVCNAYDVYNGQVLRGMLCAGPLAGGIDSCQGDSGGPLQCDNILYGIVSHGDGCAGVNRPGIYTDTYYFREWILENRSQKLLLSQIVSILSMLVHNLYYFNCL